jgi:hypothetical protein
MSNPDSGGGIGFDFAAGLQASIGSLADELKAWRSERQRTAQAIHLFTLSGMPISLTASAGTLDQPNLLGPRTGHFWDIRRISCTGYTVGTVTVYLNSTSGDIVAVFSTAGVLLNGKAQLMLGANDRLIFSAATITGTVTIGLAGVEIDADRIGEYLI